MGSIRPKIFTIPAGIPFAHALAAGVVAESGRNPLALAEALVFVPTKRAARALREAFAEALGGAALLPRIKALGDAEDEDGLFDPSTEDITAPPVIGSLRRRFLLASLVQHWGKARGAPIPIVQAVMHAGELSRFLDEAITQSADLTKLAQLADGQYAAHWQDVVKFLDIVARHWPERLKAEGAAEAAQRRDANLRALAAKLEQHPPRGPVIAAGSTGSIPATAELLKTIAHLARGCVVLPGLDEDLDEPSWNALDAAHAQFGLRQLLTHIGAERADVQRWPTGADYAGRAARVRFLSEALRPPPTTDAWRELMEGEAGVWTSALDNFSRIAAANPREEAVVIACALREALETPGRTAALVTPDRGLARRVAAELARWDIAIDDSAGQKLSATPQGAFLSLLARAAAEDFAPVALLALLKHPLATGGEERAPFLSHVRALEEWALRGLTPAPGLAGIAARLERNKKTPESLQRWFANLASLFEPSTAAMGSDTATLAELAHAHAQTAEKLASSETLWRGQAGEAAANLIAELIKDGKDISPGDARAYGELFRALAEERAVRPRFNRHPRLAILGPLEARLLDFDLVVLGGLNEGTWPAEAATDPWLSRPMREQLGLDPPERRLGLAAHDFATLAASQRVLLTRSLKENGSPTVPSRWLLRVEQLARGLKLDVALHTRQDLRDWARDIDRGPREKRAARPSPRPAFAARPRKLSVTEIETWLRDPYAIYAKHVLGLKPLDPVENEPGPSERGIAIHRALETFLKHYPDVLPSDALDHLIAIGEAAFADAGATDAVLALWRPRYLRAAKWFLAYESERRARIAKSHVEVTGTLELKTRAPFTLVGRADRIDIFKNGAAGILDYKTGRAPSDKQMQTFKSPQLPLEAAMLTAGAFGDCCASSVLELAHVRLTGGEPPGEARVAKVVPDDLAMETLAKLVRQIARYDDEAQGYVSREMPFRTTDAGDYDHLARVREWSQLAEADE